MPATTPGAITPAVASTGPTPPAQQQEDAAAALAALGARAVGDAVNAVYEYVADGFDAFDATVLKSMQMTPDQAAALLRGSVQLHAHLQARVDAHLTAFEVAALEGPLRPPVGVLPPVPAPADGATPADEAAADTDLEAARAAARAARAKAARSRRELAALSAEVEAWGNAGPLAAVPTVGGAAGWAAGKDAAAADAGAIAAKALALASLVPRAEAAAAAVPHGGGRSRDAGDAVLAEVDAFRSAAGGVDAGSLRRLRELVAPTV